MNTVIGLIKPMAIGWCAFFGFALIMGAPVPAAAHVATTFLPILFGILYVWGCVSLMREGKGFGQDIDGQQDH